MDSDFGKVVKAINEEQVTGSQVSKDRPSIYKDRPSIYDALRLSDSDLSESDTDLSKPDTKKSLSIKRKNRIIKCRGYVFDFLNTMEDIAYVRNVAKSEDTRKTIDDDFRSGITRRTRVLNPYIQYVRIQNPSDKGATVPWSELTDILALWDKLPVEPVEPVENIWYRSIVFLLPCLAVILHCFVKIEGPVKVKRRQYPAPTVDGR